MFRKHHNLFFLFFFYIVGKQYKKRILIYIVAEKKTSKKPIGNITYWKKYKELGYIILPSYKKHQNGFIILLYKNPNKVTHENYFDMTDILWPKEDVLYRVSYKELPTEYGKN